MITSDMLVDSHQFCSGWFSVAVSYFNGKSLIFCVLSSSFLRWCVENAFVFAKPLAQHAFAENITLHIVECPKDSLFFLEALSSLLCYGLAKAFQVSSSRFR